MKTFAFASAVVCAAAEQSDGHLRTARIAASVTPRLDPERPHKFDKDYPDDGRPDIKMLKDKGFHDFKLPFPSVQASDHFDKDYVKDENSDNGEWQAQADYDFLKGKLEKGQKALTEAKKREDVEKGEVDKMTKKEKEMLDKIGTAKGTVEQKQKARKTLEAEEKAAWDKFVKAREEAGNFSWSKVPTDAVDKARWFLKKEEMEFEQCKKELEAARQKLVEVQRAYDAKIAAQKQLDEANKANLLKEADEDDAKANALKKDEEKEKAEEADANKAESDAKAMQAGAEKEAAAEKAKMDSINSAVDVAKAKLDKANSELEKAECALRHYRGESPCPDATVPYTPAGAAALHSKKSSANAFGAVSSLVVAAVALTAFSA